MTDLIVRQPETTPVSWNKAEIAAEVAAIARRYEGVVVTDKAQAKKDRAECNRILKQIDDARKAVKRQYEAPLKAFEADVREIVEPLKAARDAIDAQVVQMEAAEQKARREALEAVWNAYEHSVPLERVWDARWLNASVSLNKATNEMKATGDVADAEVKCIRDMHSKHEAALIDRYCSGSTLAEVMAYRTHLEAMEAEAAQEESTPVPAPAALFFGLAQRNDPHAENPLNVYNITEHGVEVVAAKHHHTIALTCSDATLDRVCDALDALGVFFVVD